jgi:hypothetical protein
MRSARTGTMALVLALLALSACQEPGQPGPMERAGAQIDHVTGKVTRSVGEFGVRAGEGVDQAGRSVGATAQRAGTRLHDSLVPVDETKAQNGTKAQNAAPDGPSRPAP